MPTSKPLPLRRFASSLCVRAQLSQRELTEQMLANLLDRGCVVTSIIDHGSRVAAVDGRMAKDIRGEDGPRLRVVGLEGGQCPDRRCQHQPATGLVERDRRPDWGPRQLHRPAPSAVRDRSHVGEDMTVLVPPLRRLEAGGSRRHPRHTAIEWQHSAEREEPPRK